MILLKPEILKTEMTLVLRPSLEVKSVEVMMQNLLKLLCETEHES